MTTAGRLQPPLALLVSMVRDGSEEARVEAAGVLRNLALNDDSPQGCPGHRLVHGGT